MSQENVEIVRQNYEQLSKAGTPLAHLWTLLDGRVVRFQAFLTKADALKAVGLSA